MQARIHEIELGKLKRKAKEAEATLAELDRAMDSLLVAELPMHSVAVRRYAAWQRQLSDAEKESSKELKSIIDRRTREHLCGLLCEAVKHRQMRAEVENGILELISLKASASFRQGGTD